MYKFITVALLLGMIGLTSACSTVKGIGKDIQTGGEKVEQLSDKTQKKM